MPANLLRSIQAYARSLGIALRAIDNILARMPTGEGATPSSALLEELLPDLPHRLTLFQDLIPVKKNTSCPIFLAELLQFVPLDDTAEHILMLGYVASPTNGYPPVPGGHQAHSPGSALPYHQQVDTFVTDST